MHPYNPHMPQFGYYGSPPPPVPGPMHGGDMHGGPMHGGAMHGGPMQGGYFASPPGYGYYGAPPPQSQSQQPPTSMSNPSHVPPPGVDVSEFSPEDIEFLNQPLSKSYYQFGGPSSARPCGQDIKAKLVCMLSKHLDFQTVAMLSAKTVDQLCRIYCNTDPRATFKQLHIVRKPIASLFKIMRPLIGGFFLGNTKQRTYKILNYISN